ncbi:hypothetical protein LJ655_03425 [Paraburkholderia sp. MMS20-SJTN17]|uniref:HK97 family phage major capsid protein n=1 Tax=Paraburkholderia translucens TaxID=2886945 RepID=A0ABS8K879_9BURK|nr:hypothetical protein [Paraburkholderia sp. MMS20-SJTN17]
MRAGRALAISGNDPQAARAWVAAQYGSNDPALALIGRAAMIGTGSIEPPDEYGAALAAATIRRSVLGRIEAVSAFARVNFNEPLMRASDTAVGFWVEENMETPMLEGVDPFAITRLPVTKLGGLAVFSTEFVRQAGPRADSVIQRCMENSLIRRLDVSLFDGQAGDPSRPPSLIDSTIAGTGNAGEDIGAALSTLPEEFGEQIVLVVSPWSVPALIASGVADSSTLNARTGGVLLGFPCITSTAVPVSSIAWLAPALIQLADAGVIVGASEASIVRVDTGDGVELHSCWQENLTAMRAVLYVGWRKLEPAAAGMVTDVVPATIRPRAPKAKRPTAAR